MSQGKQAKVLTEGQIKFALSHIKDSRHAKRNTVIFLLSIKAGLRAKEISLVTWGMVTDPEGRISDCISLENRASKGNSGRILPMHKMLSEALKAHKGDRQIDPSDCVVHSERGDRMKTSSVVCWFQRLYKDLGFDGCSSHSGRRTFITSAAKKTSLVGASLRDVQQLAGHSSLNMTQRYIEGDSEAKRKLINLI